jgi:hypothetical protein
MQTGWACPGKVQEILEMMLPLCPHHGQNPTGQG